MLHLWSWDSFYYHKEKSDQDGKKNISKHVFSWFFMVSASICKHMIKLTAVNIITATHTLLWKNLKWWVQSCSKSFIFWNLEGVQNITFKITLYYTILECYLKLVNHIFCYFSILTTKPLKCKQNALKLYTVPSEKQGKSYAQCKEDCAPISLQCVCIVSSVKCK